VATNVLNVGADRDHFPHLGPPRVDNEVRVVDEQASDSKPLGFFEDRDDRGGIEVP
jgi:hypothetical protein